MALIKAAYIDDLSKAAQDRFMMVMDHYGIQFKKVGKERVAKCVFHEEKTPSMSVSEHRGAFHCKGCLEGGYAKDFIMKYDRLSYPEAIIKLASIIGFREVEYDREEMTAEEKSGIRMKNQVKAVLNEASSVFCDNFATSDRGLQFALSRGLTDEDVTRFQIGYSQNSNKSLMSDLARYGNESLYAAGLLGVDTRSTTEPPRYYDFQRDRLMFPIRDMGGSVVSFGGRALTYTKGAPFAKYLNGRETEVFKKSDHLYGLYESTLAPRIPGAQTFNVVEGYLDVVASHRAGITNTVATMGTAISSEQIATLLRKADTVRFVFDGDAAGVKAAFSALKNALPVLKPEKRISFCLVEKGHDPDSLISGGRLQEYVQCLDQALPPDQFLSRYVIDKLGNSVEGIAESSRVVNEVISCIKDENVKYAYRKTFEHLVDTATAPDKVNASMVHFHALSEQAQATIASMDNDEINLVGWLINEPTVFKLLSEATVSNLSSEGQRMASFVNERTSVVDKILTKEEPNQVTHLFRFFSLRTDDVPISELINSLHAINIRSALSAELVSNDSSRPV